MSSDKAKEQASVPAEQTADTEPISPSVSPLSTAPPPPSGGSSGDGKRLPESFTSTVLDLLKRPPVGFIRGGGTPTSASEQLYEDSFRDAERRRDELDHDKKVGSTPIEEGGGMLYTSQLTDKPELPKAYVQIIYVNQRGGLTGEEGVADLLIGIDDNFPFELTLVLVCPKCAAGQKHLQDCQMQIRQRNRYFEMDMAKGPETFPFLDDPATNRWEIYRSAGVVRESEPCSCGDCGWRFVLNSGKHPKTGALVTFCRELPR